MKTIQLIGKKLQLVSLFISNDASRIYGIIKIFRVVESFDDR